MPAPAQAKSKKSARPHDIDRHVGARMRQRRIMLGLTQQQMAELIGVTYQQAHKYEKGINRIAGGRLYAIARALGVDVNYLFEGLRPEGRAYAPTLEQRMLLELTRNFINIPSRQQQEAICNLARAIANLNPPQPGESIRPKPEGGGGTLSEGRSSSSSRGGSPVSLT